MAGHPHVSQIALSLAERFTLTDNFPSSAFVTGAPFNVVLVYVPQQAQILLGKSPLDSGIYLIGYSAVAAVAAALVTIASSRGRIPFIYSLLGGCAIHTVGVGLLSTVATSKGFHVTDIVYEVIAGAGIGLTMGILILSIPYIVEDRDIGRPPTEQLADNNLCIDLLIFFFLNIAIATGAVIQFRFLGGAISLAIASNILNGNLAHRLQGILSSHELHLFLENVKSVGYLSPDLQEEVKSIFASSYSTQLKVMIGFAAAQLPAILLLVKPGRQLAADRVHSGQ